LAVYVGDKLIIDLYGNTFGDLSPYNADSLTTIFSSGKSVASILMGIMYDKGVVDYNALVTDYWPEFGGNDKGHLKVVNIMRHEGCMASFDEPFDVADAYTDTIK